VPVGVQMEIADDTVPITVHRLTDDLAREARTHRRTRSCRRSIIEPASVLCAAPKTPGSIAPRSCPRKPYAVQIAARRKQPPRRMCTVRLGW